MSKEKSASKKEKTTPAPKPKKSFQGTKQDDVLTKNDRIQTITEIFTNDFGNELTAFIGRILECQFTGMSLIDMGEMLNSKNELIFASFQIQADKYYGFISIEPVLLNTIICSLYGSEGNFEYDPKIIQFGKCSLNVAGKFVAIALSCLEKATEGIIDLNISLVDTHNKLKAVNSQKVPSNAYQMTFNIEGIERSDSMHIILPQSLIEKITYSNNPVNDKQSNSDIEDHKISDDVIDSTVDLTVLLPEIKLKLPDVMKLQAGDLIPISNPQEVELKLGDRRAYKAVVGQADEKKVVKIAEVLSKK